MKRIHRTEKAPRPIGPYSQAVEASGFVFCSGQIPLDPATGEMEPGNLEAQTRRVLDNLGAVLEASGSSWEGVVKTTIFLADMADFAEVNRVYAGYFPTEPPARSVVQAAALPKAARLEMEAVALKLNR